MSGVQLSRASEQKRRCCCQPWLDSDPQVNEAAIQATRRKAEDIIYCWKAMEIAMELVAKESM